MDPRGSTGDMGYDQIEHVPGGAIIGERRAEERFVSLPKSHPAWNKVICGDALHTLRRTETGSVGAVISDPPFFTSIGRNHGPIGGVGVDPWAPGVGLTSSAVDWARPVARELRRVTRKGGAVVLMAGVHAVAAWMQACEEAGLIWMAELDVLWNAGKPRACNFGSLVTHVLWFTVPGARHTWNSKKRSIYSNVLVCTKVNPHDRDHPAQKPVELTTFLVSLLTKEGDGVVDPFCGSGSTLVSCQVVGRDWLGIDQDKRYCGIATRRARNFEIEDEGPLKLWINGRLEEV